LERKLQTHHKEEQNNSEFREETRAFCRAHDCEAVWAEAEPCGQISQHRGQSKSKGQGNRDSRGQYNGQDFLE